MPYCQYCGSSSCSGGCVTTGGFARPPMSDAREQLLTDALDFIALVAGTTCTQGPTATHPDYCLKCRADALMRRAGRAR